MNANEFRIRLTSGDHLPVQADGIQVHESGALVFVNQDANGNPVPNLIVSPHAYQRAWGVGPVQPQPAVAPAAPTPPNRQQRRAKAKA